jgi:hypothetical protein
VQRDITEKLANVAREAITGSGRIIMRCLTQLIEASNSMCGSLVAVPVKTAAGTTIVGR